MVPARFRAVATLLIGIADWLSKEPGIMARNQART